MDPVFVVFWMTMAVLGGFLAAYVTTNADIRISSAVLMSFVAIGLTLGSFMGNPWPPTLIAVAMTTGLAWACLDWVYVANHELDEESSRRILRHILREARFLSLPYVELSTRYVPMPQRGSGPGIMEGS